MIELYNSFSIQNTALRWWLKSESLQKLAGFLEQRNKDPENVCSFFMEIYTSDINSENIFPPSLFSLSIYFLAKHANLC